MLEDCLFGRIVIVKVNILDMKLNELPRKEMRIFRSNVRDSIILRERTNFFWRCLFQAYHSCSATSCGIRLSTSFCCQRAARARSPDRRSIHPISNINVTRTDRSYQGRATYSQLWCCPNLLNLIIGACQFPTLGFVVDRWRRVENFVPEQFWSIKLSVLRDGIDVKFNWKRGHLFDRLCCLCLYEMCLDKGMARVASVITKPRSKW